MEAEKAKESETTAISAEELKKLRDENAALKKQAEEFEKKVDLQKYIDKRIDEVAQKKLEEQVSKEEQELAKARELLAKAQENERIARELDENRKYSATETWKENKKAEFIHNWNLLNECIRQGKYMSDAFDLRNSRNRTMAKVAYATQILTGEQAGNLMIGKMTSAGLKY